MYRAKGLALVFAVLCINVVPCQGRFLGAVDDAVDLDALPEVQLNGVGLMDILQTTSTSAAKPRGDGANFDEILASDDLQDVLSKLGMESDALPSPLNTKLALKLLKLELLDQFVAKKTTLNPYADNNFLTGNKFLFGQTITDEANPITVSFEIPIPNAVVVVGPIREERSKGRPSRAAFESQVSHVTQHGFALRTLSHCDRGPSRSRNISVEWLAISEGYYYVGSNKLRLQVGKVEVDGETEISLDTLFKNNPAVVGALQNTDFATRDPEGNIPRIVSIYKDKFSVGLQTAEDEEFITDSATPNHFGFFAMEQGVTSIPRFDRTSFLTFVTNVTSETYNSEDEFLDVSAGGFKVRPYLLANISKSDVRSCLLGVCTRQNPVTHPREEQIKVKISLLDHLNQPPGGGPPGGGPPGGGPPGGGPPGGGPPGGGRPGGGRPAGGPPGGGPPGGGGGRNGREPEDHFVSFFAFGLSLKSVLLSKF